nr:hypothetical protein GCM10025732_28520 [Glycomyces mayteni]
MTRAPLRRAAAAVAAGTAALSLTACGAFGGGTGTDGSDAGDGVITFWHYYGDPHGVPLEAALARYAEETGVEVEPRFIPFEDFSRTLQQQAAAGGLPDIALVNAFETGQLADAGIIEDLSAYADEWGEQDAYYEAGWETGQVDGATYGIPHLADDYALYYNEDVLAAAGVEVPTTWDEMEAAAAAIADSGAASYGLAMSGIEGAEGATGILLRTLAAGGDLAGFGGEAGVAALESIQRMTASGGLSEGFLTWNEDDAMAAFTNGEAAMAINSASAVNVVRENAPTSPGTWPRCPPTPPRRPSCPPRTSPSARAAATPTPPGTSSSGSSSRASWRSTCPSATSSPPAPTCPAPSPTRSGRSSPTSS